MMSDAALYLMTGRMVEGRRTKARRGERLNHPPLGDGRGPDGDYPWAPDEPAPWVSRLSLKPFAAPGSLHGRRRYVVAQDIRRPIRPHWGPTRGQRVWRRPTRMT
jgi:hypothetical protein